MRNGNFVGQIFHPTVIENIIKGLFDGDVFFFNVYINGKTQIYKIVVELTEDGKEKWSFIRDNTTYKPSVEETMSPTFNYNREDMVIKIMTNSTLPMPVGTEVTENCAVDMAEYVMIYIDALETVEK